MDMKVETKPSTADVGEVFVIVTELTKRKFPFPPETWLEERLTKITNAVDAHSAVLIFILLVMALVGALFRDADLLVFTIAGSTTVALVGCAIIVAWIPLRVAMLWRARKDPYCLFLELVESRLAFFNGYVQRLVSCDIAALKLVKAEYEIERKQYQERGDFLTGAVSKLGILPAIAGALILGSQLTSIFGFGNWTITLVSVILVFHVRNFSVVTKLHQMDRVIMALELAIERAAG